MGVDQEWQVALYHGQFGKIKKKQRITKNKGKERIFKSSFEMRQMEASPEKQRGKQHTEKTEAETEDSTATTLSFSDHMRKLQTTVKEN